MCDLFLTPDVQTMLTNKFVVIIGDSIQRSVYKDLIQILQQNEYITSDKLKKRGEKSCNGDRLIEGGVLGEMTNKKSYREVREYQTDYHLIRFYFITRCYNNYMESIINDLKQEPKPDVVIMSSCLWDITRYGASSVPEYKKNLIKLCSRLSEALPEECLVIWNTALPVSSKIKGGFLIPEVEFMSDTLRLDIMEANFYARQVVVDYNFDVLDMHFYFRRLMHHRVGDGVHWDMVAHRRMTNLMMTHVAQAWGILLPRRNAPLIHTPQPSKFNPKQSAELHNSFHEVPQTTVIPVPHEVPQAPFIPLQQDPSPANTPLAASAVDRYGGPIRRTVYYGSDANPQYTQQGSSNTFTPDSGCDPNPHIQFNFTVLPGSQWSGYNNNFNSPGHCPPAGRYQPYYNPNSGMYNRGHTNQQPQWW